MGRRIKRRFFEKIVVDSAGAKGKSIAKAPDGKVIFVANAVPGDIIDLQTTKVRKAYYEARAVTFHHYSEKRTTPKCSHFGTCGGCKWQFMDYAHQLSYKQNEVVQNLERLAGISAKTVLPILAASKRYNYRNKMEFSFSNSRWLSQEEIQSNQEITNRNALGFHMPGMWDKILNIDQCHLQAAPSNQIRNSIRDFAIRHQIPFFDLKKQEGLLRNLLIRTSLTGDIMVLIQFFYEDKMLRELLLDAVAKQFPEITSLQYVINSKANDTIYDQEVVCYAGKPYIEETMEGLRFRIQAKSFYQTNSEQAYNLYTVVRDFANLQGDEIVYDLYTGTGTIAQFIAKKAKKVVGIELIPDAIDDAKANAKRNQIQNTFFYAGAIQKILTPTWVAAHGHPDLIITDPPREGMHKEVVKQILEVQPKKIVYVSCNSATQARDLAMLAPIYQVKKLQVIDMFPQTYHTESVVLLQKIKS